MKGHSARARAYVDRAKKHGAAFEWFEPDEIFARDEFVCMEYPGKPCACGKLARADVEAGHPDFATLGHFPAMANGGPHLRTSTFCQRWECNAEQNNHVDTPTRAKWRRQARLTGPQSDRAQAKKQKMQSRPFAGSRGLSTGAIRWRGRT